MRKALETLRKGGVLESRQGFGWYVAFEPVHQRLGQFSTIEEQLYEVGMTPSRQVLSSRRMKATGRIEEVLGSGEMLEVKRLNLADGLPFARVTVWIPAHLGYEFSMKDLEENSLYRLLSDSTLLLRPLAKATQSIAAEAIGESDALLLGVPPNSPGLICERVTFDTGGYPVLLSEYVFPGSRTQFVTELTSQVGSIALSGLKLVE